MVLKSLRRGDFTLELSVWATVSLALHSLSAAWARTVSTSVPDPYLDEVFHVRQAQAYCDGRFTQWDAKITTPPGLYLLSWVLYRIWYPCSTVSLRQINVALLSIVLFNGCLHYLLHVTQRWTAKNGASASVSTSQATRILIQKIHTSLNVCLFPPLFFFCALYYTDIGSTALVVAGAWLQHHPKLALHPKIRGSCIVLNGILALLFRQTNIFWVGVFPAAIDTVAVLGKSFPVKNNVASTSSLLTALRDVASQSWSQGTVYDTPFEIAELQDYVLVAISLGIAVFSKLWLVMSTAAPYLTLVISFAGFVILNGSVVLGDKSNHVATLHLPQMLYIWPFIMFFSFPMIALHVIAFCIPRRYLTGSVFKQYKSGTGKSTTTTRATLFSLTALVGTLIAIHKNTIVHPFTLADNRHYVFYVFRILLRHPSVRYVVAPVYLVCAWATLRTFCTPRTSEPQWSKNQKSTRDRSQEGDNQNPVMTSYVLIWLVTTAMTLVTAPLVEPRYFILPWIFWRVHVPGPAVKPVTESIAEATMKQEKDMPDAQNAPTRRLKYLVQVLNHGDQRLFAETAWFLLLNAVTGYIFLYWGFEWPQEKGNIQRFMW